MNNRLLVNYFIILFGGIVWLVCVEFLLLLFDKIKINQILQTTTSINEFADGCCVHYLWLMILVYLNYISN